MNQIHITSFVLILYQENLISVLNYDTFKLNHPLNFLSNAHPHTFPEKTVIETSCEHKTSENPIHATTKVQPCTFPRISRETGKLVTSPNPVSTLESESACCFPIWVVGSF